MHVDLKSNTELQALNILDLSNDVSLVLSFKSYCVQDLTIIVGKVKEIKSQNIDVKVIIQAEGINFNDEELKIMISLGAKLKEIGVPLYFDGGIKETYTIDELIKADKQLDEIIDKLNNSELSPLEKYIYIYNFLTRKKYKLDPREYDEDSINDYAHLPRDIISVMNTDYIVCQGYAELNAYLCKNVGISCYTNQVYVIDRKGSEAHMNNVVFLKDEKYNINGVFYSDACWDNDPNNHEYSFMLLPMSDVNKMRVHIREMSSHILFIPYIPSVFGYIEGQQGVDIVYPASDENKKPFYAFDDYAEQFNIKDELVHNMERAFSLLKLNFSNVDTLIDTFKENEIPEDIYERLGSYSPNSTSLPFFLAATLLGNNEKILERSFSTLSKTLEQKEFAPELVFDNPELDAFDKTHSRDINDVYVTLEDVKKFSLDELGDSFLDFYDKFNNYFNAKMDKEYDHEEYNSTYLHHDMIFEILYDTVLRMQRMLIHTYFQREIFKKDSPFIEISYKTFKQALLNVFIFEGLSKEDAEEAVNKAIKLTDNINKKAYHSIAYSYNWLEQEKE